MILKKSPGRDLTFSMDWDVFVKISALVKSSNTEIRVDLLFDNEDPRHITGFSMVPQKVSSGSVDIDADRIGDYFEALVKEHGKEYAMKMMAIRGIVHCHPGKSRPHPSGTDDNDMQKLLNIAHEPYFINIIFSEDASEYIVVVAVRSDNEYFGESMQMYEGELEIIKPDNFIEGVKEKRKEIKKCNKKIEEWKEKLEKVKNDLGSSCDIPDEIMEWAEKELKEKLSTYTYTQTGDTASNWFQKQMEKERRTKKNRRSKKKGEKCIIYPERTIGSVKCRKRCKDRLKCLLLKKWEEEQENKKKKKFPPQTGVL